MIFLRSLIFNCVFFTWTFLLGFLFLPFLLLPLRLILWLEDFWARSTLYFLKIIVGLDYRVIGKHHLPSPPFIVASKHQSAWDTIVINTIFHNPAAVLKGELLHIPLYGWYLRKFKMIPIERTNRTPIRALRRFLKASEKAAHEKRSIIIFPEGSRVPPGKCIPYQGGVYTLYHHLKIPVVPVALNSGLFWGRRHFLKKPGLITFQILPPIHPGLSRDVFMKELENTVETASEKLLF